MVPNTRIKIVRFRSLGRRYCGAPYAGRVCRAWHLTREVKVLLPGIRRAEG
jgi:hypothetical protein